MGQALNPDFQNSNGASVTLFGRLEAATLVTCAIGQLVPAASMDTDGLPVAGSLTLNFPADTSGALYQPISAGGCGVSTADAGFSIAATVTAVTSTHYTKQLSLSLGQSSINIWLKLDSTAGTLNVMTLEDQRPAGRYAVDRMIANISGINTPGAGKVLFEYEHRLQQRQSG